MSQRSDQVSTQSVLKRLRSTGSVIEKLKGTGELTVDETETADRLQAVMSYVQKALDGMDPVLVLLRTASLKE